MINKKNNQNNRVFFISIALILFCLLNVFTIITIKDFGIYLSFLLVILPISILTFSLGFDKYGYFDCIVIIFSLLFFIIAPIVQLNNSNLPNTLDIRYNLILKTNLYVGIFFISYVLFKLSLKSKKSKIQFKFEIKNIKAINMIMGTIFIIVFILNLKYIFNAIILRQYSENISLSADLIKRKYIFSFPVYLFVYNIYISKVKNNNKSSKLKIKNIFLLSIIFILLVLVKNPFLEKRNSIGPLYLALIFFLLFKYINLRRFFMIMLIVQLILFPISTIFTHSTQGIFDILKSIDINYLTQTFKNEFTTLHYDAWSNFMATIDYVSNNGYSYGVQFIGAILFFIPRTIWINKPIGSGQLIGNYLMANYGMWFNNLSNPFISEGYINFGVIGVLIFAFILAYLGKIVRECIKSNGYLIFIGIYVSIYMMFFIRGDFMSAFSYVVGFIGATVITPLILDKIISFIKLK